MVVLVALLLLLIRRCYVGGIAERNGLSGLTRHLEDVVFLFDVPFEYTTLQRLLIRFLRVALSRKTIRLPHHLGFGHHS